MSIKAILASLLLMLSWLPAYNAQAAPVVKPATKLPPKQKPGANLTSAYNAYLNRLRTKVLNNWNYPDGKNRVNLQVTVNPDGSTGDIALTSAPGNQSAEQAANGAFAQAQPLEALPSGSPSAKLILTFESNADPHGNSSSNLQARLEPIAGSPDAKAEPPVKSGDSTQP